MKLSFFSNYLNEHQLPLCNAFATLEGVEFTFVALSEQGGNAGRSNLNTAFSFVLREYEDEKSSAEAKRHAENDDIVIFGHLCGKEQYVKQRMRRNLLSFRATERLLKRGLWWRFAPPKALRTYRWFIQFKKKQMYILCISSYASFDLALSGWPIEKCFKWGYFSEASPALEERECDSGKTLSIVWAARLVQWKRPLAPLYLAQKLKLAGYSFRLELAGDGPLMDEMKRFVDGNDLSDCVTLHGMLGGDEVKELMRRGDIYITTSSREEGWGITVNEAMAAGCAVVASASIGSAPFLIDDGVNGLLYDDLSDDDLFLKVSRLLDNPEYRHSMAACAHETVMGEWSPGGAAKRFVRLGESLLAGNPVVFETGPCSNADVLKDGWYHAKTREVGNA